MTCIVALVSDGKVHMAGDKLASNGFLITRSRAKATQYITDNYGKGFFKLRTMKIEKTKNELTVRGTATR